MRDLLLSVVVMGIHRGLLLRNWIFGLRYPVYGGVAATMERCSIDVGRVSLDAQMVLPEDLRPASAVLLLHGIGETVQHWQAVQQVFAAEGIASLVVDYRGFGRSRGWFSTNAAELDALAAYQYLERRLPGTGISLVGFSLGSGVAAAVCRQTGAELLVLCAGYPSLRKAVRAMGMPVWIARLIRNVWCPEEVVRTCATPVLIAHGEDDWLFPCELARELSFACSSPCELVVVAGISHDDPVFRPSASFWGPVMERIKRSERAAG